MRNIVGLIMWWTALVLLPAWLYYASIHQVLVAIFVYWFFGDVVQSLFNHRWAAHSLWTPPKWLQYTLATLSTFGFANSPIKWCAYHRTHHAFSDTEKDPHSPKYMHPLNVALLYRLHAGQIKRAVERIRVKYFVWLEKHELLILLGGHSILFFSVGWLWYLTIVVPISYATLAINTVINYGSHKEGAPKNLSWIWWPLVFSEIYHGSHHDNPQLNYTKYDVSGWLATRMGWVKNETNR